MPGPDMNNHLHGLVDMGSNGIRFSITNLSPPTARYLPTVYTSRSGISLYDAQYSSPDGNRGPIPANVIESVVSAFRGFRSTCLDFGVPAANITILATEATRTPPNSKEFLGEIKEKVGWEVGLLAKEEEGRVGAMGIASSFEEVDGLVMDLGGGSTQITWMTARNGKVQTSPKGSFSFPYGAAAMIKRLAETEKVGHGAKEKLAEEMRTNFRQAFNELDIPKDLLQTAERQGGFSLYLSGGGFRVWGYLLMSQSDIQPYPIPIINGFQVNVSAFRNTMKIQDVASSEKIFRVSKRRASQVPAVAFLVNVLIDALPRIKSIQFCQGGVREGYFFDSLGQEIRSEPPLPAATSLHAPPSANELASLLSDALPKATPPLKELAVPSSIDESLTRSTVNMLFAHASHPKETASLSALYAPVTGSLASAHGISHKNRSLLSLILCERWDGELPPDHTSFRGRLSQLLTPQEVWWAHYLGRVAALIAEFYPAGVVREERVAFEAKWENIVGKKEMTEVGIHLEIRTPAEVGGEGADSYAAVVKEIEKLGKKKNRSGGDKGIGLPVEVQWHGTRIEGHQGGDEEQMSE